MDPKELEALKTSNPKAYDSYVKLQSELEEERNKKKEDKEKKKAKKEIEEDDEDLDEDEESDDDEEDSLRSKVKKAKATKEGKEQETKQLESALTFNLGLQEFLKTNQDLLPEEVSEIVTASAKETYDSAIERASVLKAEIFQSFFSVQENVDLLTTSQKATLDGYLKLTKNGKESKAESVFENLFEPALETLRKLKKAEEVGKSRSGHGSSSKVEDQYRERLIKTSKKTYLGEKGA